MVWWVDLVWTLLYPSHPQLSRGEKILPQRLLDQENHREGSRAHYSYGHNRLELGKLIQFITYQILVG